MSSDNLRKCCQNVIVSPSFQPFAHGTERAVVHEPGYMCSVHGGASHGVHGMNIRWLLRSNLGVAQFLVFTGWLPGHTSYMPSLYPMTVDLGYHAYMAQYKGHKPSPHNCEYLIGQYPCFYDGSASNAAELFREYTTYGEDAIWRALINTISELNA